MQDSTKPADSKKTLEEPIQESGSKQNKSTNLEEPIQ
jgi:hypothetical protein